MQLDFNILFGVEILHGYFRDQIPKGISVQTSTEGRGVLYGCEWLLRQTASGFQVLSRTNSSAKKLQPKFVPAEEVSIPFVFRVENPLFFNYTDLPFQPGQIMYSNSSMILKGGKVSYKFLPVQPGRFAYTFENGAEILKSWAVEDVMGNTVLQKTFYGEYSALSLGVDLTSEPEGCYQLKYKTKDKTFSYSFYMSTELYRQPGLAVFEWQYPSVYNKKWKGTWQFNKMYSWKMEALSTYWRYHCVAKNGSALKGLAIPKAKINGNEVSFSVIEAKQNLPDGNQATVFVSDQPVSLLQFPSGTIELDIPGASEGLRLPFASPEFIHSGTLPKGKKPVRFSDIYVYI